MNKEEFLKALEDILEMENLTETSSLTLSSLQKLSIIVFADENYDKLLSAEELVSIHSVTDLMSLIGVSF